MEWYADFENVLILAHRLVDAGEITQVNELLYFFEKPWKWSREWADYQASKVPTIVEP